jgi:DNA-binding NarL/FixJ family response regulator
VASDWGSVLIVDEDRGFRTLVSKILARAGFDTREASSGEAAVADVRAQRPAVVLLDVCLPDVNGFEVCRELRDEFGEELPVIFVSGDRTEPLDRTVGLLLGGDDYVVKPFDPDELLARVRRLVTRSRQNGRGSGIAAPDHALTPRELQVLQRFAQGLRASQIAEELVISPKTVASHVQRVLAKLGAHSRAQAVAFAYESGLVTATPRPDGSGAGEGSNHRPRD